MTKFPSEKMLANVERKLVKGPASRPMPKGVGPVEKMKYELCEKFVLYKNSHKNLTQSKMAKMLRVDEGLLSKILHYHINEFTIDRLIDILKNLYEKVEVDIKTEKIRVA